MRKLASFGIGLALSLSTISSVWAECTYNEAEALNAKITGTGITTDPSSDSWTAELEERFEEIKSRFLEVSEEHTVAVTAHDQNALNTACEGYRAILVEIDELAKQLN